MLRALLTSYVEGDGDFVVLTGANRVRRFASLDETLYEAGRSLPCRVLLPAGRYDAAGLLFPTGVEYHGVGLRYNTSQLPVFGSAATIIAGGAVQGQGDGIAKFSGLVFDGGLTVRRQRTLIEQCGFVGDDGLHLDQDNRGAPYYAVVDACWFRGVRAPSILLTAQANRITIRDSIIMPGQDQRGIVAEGVLTAYPQGLHCVGNSFELHGGTTRVGSWVYGDFQNGHFAQNYIDTRRAPLLDGADYVLTERSRNNKVVAFNRYDDTFISRGAANDFVAATDCLYTNQDGIDLGKFAGIYRHYTLGPGVTRAVLPPAGWGGEFRVTTERADTVLEASPGEAVSGLAAIPVKRGEVWSLFVKPGATMVRVAARLGS